MSLGNMNGYQIPGGGNHSPYPIQETYPPYGSPGSGSGWGSPGGYGSPQASYNHSSFGGVPTSYGSYNTSSREQELAAENRKLKEELWRLKQGQNPGGFTSSRALSMAPFPSPKASPTAGSIYDVGAQQNMFASQGYGSQQPCFQQPPYGPACGANHAYPSASSTYGVGAQPNTFATQSYGPNQHGYQQPAYSSAYGASRYNQRRKKGCC
eukprot:TRINITY_DN31054_c0_g1_i1.p1 TRINITY_DN31054_c0_g1~~TRINITY_DN31054_c0_g1_i1.p1  ORF type:complete len:210 (-),score=13.09 TRINITY_DN31054_c0_g1_i1:234-863(-)